LGQLPAALQAIATESRLGDPDRVVTVRIAPGFYRLSEPIVIDGQVWKQGAGKLNIEGSGTGRTIISGTQAIDLGAASADESQPAVGRGIRRITLTHHQPSSGGKVPGRVFGSFTAPDVELFADGKRLPRSRHPKEGYLKTGERSAGPAHLAIAGVDAGDYAAEPALMAGGYFQHDWADELLNVEVDRSARDFLFAGKLPTYGVRPGQRVWLENAIRDIKAPGEWAFDPASHSLWILPPQSAGTLEMSTVLNGLVLSNVGNVAVSGVEFFGFLDSGLRVENSLDVKIDSIAISHVGGTALRLNGRGIVARNITISDTGASGVSLGGGDRKTLDAGRIVVENCRIERVGRLVKSYAPAAGLNGVGNVLRNCVLRDGPHAAVVFHGNNHLIEGNLIEAFLSESDDAGAIYTGQDWTERGTIIRGNIIRIGNLERRLGNSAIYLDDQASGIRVEGNLIQGGNRCVMIGGGRDNYIVDNILATCGEGIYVDARGDLEIAKRGAGEAHAAFKRKFHAVAADSGIYAERYPELKQGMTTIGSVGKNVARGNIFVNTGMKIRTLDQASAGISVSNSLAVRGSAAIIENLLETGKIPFARRALAANGTPVEAGRE
jgi:hypothetical protein